MAIALKTKPGHTYKVIERGERFVFPGGTCQSLYAGCTGCGWNIDGCEDGGREYFNRHIENGYVQVAG